MSYKIIGSVAKATTSSGTWLERNSPYIWINGRGRSLVITPYVRNSPWTTKR
jgi:hypothetical protein